VVLGTAEGDAGVRAFGGGVHAQSVVDNGGRLNGRYSVPAESSHCRHSPPLRFGEGAGGERSWRRVGPRPLPLTLSPKRRGGNGATSDLLVPAQDLDRLGSDFPHVSVL